MSRHRFGFRPTSLALLVLLVPLACFAADGTRGPPAGAQSGPAQPQAQQQGKQSQWRWRQADRAMNQNQVLDHDRLQQRRCRRTAPAAVPPGSPSPPPVQEGTGPG